MTTPSNPNASKRSALRTFIEYLGRGATPVDGYWFDGYGFDQVSLAGRKAPGIRKVSAPQVSTSPSARRLDKCVPAAPGT